MSETDEHPRGGTVGARLRAAREAAGLSVADVAQQTRVNARHLAAIEEGDNGELPAAPYSTGFVKAYARVVGLDSVALAAEFRQDFDRTNFRTVEAVRYEPADPARLPSRTLAWAAAFVALIIILAYALWRDGRFTGETADDQARIAAAGEPAAAPPAPVAAPRPAAPVAPAPAADGPVLLTAVEPTWIRVYERAGTTLFQGELTPGQSYEVPATAAEPLIRLGRPESLKVSVGGREVAPLGKPAHTVKDVSLRGPDLLARPTDDAAPAPAPTPVAPPPAAP
ncbi:helix-turn-helix domain-containing protein [Sphingomonas quercus]|uniref:Helix-turn-helix domain-containing protein n=1 Tax=Sphingomonas quercus TaxID=2842451 RepID=A0ABS6BHE9_9SPHN|nr:helix-turn-helix domain-containing protein [Sphingomonas quercus]MBU3077728.1 helix-turn-helix domain-containing protein [Sphingomonas quercus]